jgi:hypothetical protein
MNNSGTIFSYLLVVIASMAFKSAINMYLLAYIANYVFKNAITVYKENL